MKDSSHLDGRQRNDQAPKASVGGSWSEGPDDTEAAALDETWTALGRMLEASQAPFDERTAASGVWARLAQRERAKRRRRAAMGLALAASLLAAASVTWFATREPLLAQAPTDQPVIVHKPSAPRPAKPIDEGAIAWSDEVDEELAQLDLVAGALEAGMRPRREEPADLLRSIESLERELSGGAL